MEFRWPKGLNRQRSYFMWGLRELNKRLEFSSSDDESYEIINLFIHEMDNYACMNRNTSIMFSCAADAGRYMLDGYVTTYM